MFHLGKWDQHKVCLLENVIPLKALSRLAKSAMGHSLHFQSDSDRGSCKIYLIGMFPKWNIYLERTRMFKGHTIKH